MFKHIKFAVLKSVAVAAVLTTLTPASHAADWPELKPIRVIVPWSPGGVADYLGRQLSDSLSKQLGQVVIVENKPGAGTNIGSTEVARAEPDGYTLLLASSANAANMSLYKDMRYDAVKDFVPVSLLGYTPMVLVGNPGLEPKSLKDLISYSHKNPEEITYASAGVGSPAHLAGESFKAEADVDWLHVAYKGAGPAITDLMGGQVQMMFTNVPASIGGITSGKLHAYAITGQNRSIALPDVPTFAEAGLENYDASGWYGIVAPAGTPEAITQKLYEEIKQALLEPARAESIRKQGVELVVSSPEELKNKISEDIKFYDVLTKKIGIQSNL